MSGKRQRPLRSTGSTSGTGSTSSGDTVVPVASPDVPRRDVVRVLAAAPLAAFAITLEDVDRAAEYANDALQQAARRAYVPKFYTTDEFRLVRVLGDLIIPRDERSGSASDAAVPEFLDFLMTAYPEMQKPMRDGLAWMNAASRVRSGKAFVSCTAVEQAQLLDEIAYPKRAAESARDGVTFFSRFRDLTASGFWSSRIGVRDLEYMGNRPQAAWNGCPPAALGRLGVRYS